DGNDRRDARRRQTVDRLSELLDMLEPSLLRLLPRPCRLVQLLAMLLVGHPCARRALTDLDDVIETRDGDERRQCRHGQARRLSLGEIADIAVDALAHFFEQDLEPLFPTTQG